MRCSLHAVTSTLPCDARHVVRSDGAPPVPLPPPQQCHAVTLLLCREQEAGLCVLGRADRGHVDCEVTITAEREVSGGLVWVTCEAGGLSHDLAGVYVPVSPV